jgi:uncharacterized membrane protein YeaQ/YmgE (transglycosylase-associated protein family)
VLITFCYNRYRALAAFQAGKDRLENTTSSDLNPAGVDMTIWELLILLLVAGICGAIGEAIAGYSPGGCFLSIVIGFIGALLGRWLAGLLGLPELLMISIGGRPFPVIWSIIGAALFVAIISLLSFRRRPYI